MTTSNTGTAIVPAIEKLNGMGNYGSWKFIMKMILIHEDLWECVDTKDGKPVCDDRKKQQKALARICLSINPVAITHVRNANTAWEAWHNLQTAYEDRGLCRRLGLMRQLFGMKLQEYPDMESYLMKICDVSQQLSDIGAALEDEYLAVIMLSGLTSDYDPLIMALENCNVKMSSELVKQKLLQEEQRRTNGTDTSSGSVMVAKRRDNKPVKCFRCRKLGHISRNCPEKEKDVRKPQTKSAANMLSALSVDVQENAWYIDSGASCHMCNRRDILKDFVEDTSLEVTVANGEKLYSAGRGSTELHVKDGIKTLSSVVFIPNLSCNLISVNVLTSKGFRVVFCSEFCKIYFDNVLIAIAKRENGLFKLQTFSARRSVHSSSESASADQIVANVGSERVTSQDVWHQRLGHLNSRSMNLLRTGMGKWHKF